MKKVIIAAAIAIAMTSSAGAANIVQTAASTGKFNTLLAAAKAAGLAGALGHTDGITVFAPTDEAFAKLPKGTVENLLKPENRHQLANILKYHVVPARVPSSAAKIKSAEIGTLKSSGDTTIKVRKRFGAVRVDNARVIQADIEADNGIIHVINKVLLPSD
ncbi:MAG: fasciclin domain-containing protein [Pseudomonadota bacterium]